YYRMRRCLRSTLFPYTTLFRSVSIGCFAMTDPVIDEIWTLMQAAFENGQSRVSVHIFPFPMTEANLTTHAGDLNASFWNEIAPRSEEHTSELQSRENIVCRLLL